MFKSSSQGYRVGATLLSVAEALAEGEGRQFIEWGFVMLAGISLIIFLY